MARTISYTDSVELDGQRRWSGKGYLDAKMQPVPEFADLNDIPRAQRFIGLTVTVLNGENGEPTEYWLKNGVSNTSWEKKGCRANLDVVSGNDVETSGI